MNIQYVCTFFIKVILVWHKAISIGHSGMMQLATLKNQCARLLC